MFGRLFMLMCIPGLALAETAAIHCEPDSPPIRFAAGDIQRALKSRGFKTSIVALLPQSKQTSGLQCMLGRAGNITLRKQLRAAQGACPSRIAAEGYVIRLTRHNGRLTVWGIGADATGAMYAGLSIAETIAQDGIAGLTDADCRPYIKKRGLKINVPLDARTPAYADCGDAAQKNIPVFWDLDFWKQHLDAMARDRYNAITLWNAHPFPSMVKVPDYPEVALDDVKVADIDWRKWFPKNAGHGGARGVTPDILANLKTVKTMSIDEKIAFWRNVMQYAHDRGIEFHIITWNIFVWAAAGKYGITDSVRNPATITYLRKSVRALFETYPLLAGIGVTAGEHMHGLTPDQKEDWLWKTYGLGVMDAKKAFPERRIRFIHRYWMSKIPQITKHFNGFDKDVQFDFSFKYVKARLYSNTAPKFADKVLRDAPRGTRWWWNLRNDDIFYFRWGDPDYVREFIRNLPPAEKTEGFHMGSDGYVWGREFVSTQPDTPRQLEIDKHWYRFMLWGRLGYDPTLSNAFFAKALQQRFPGKPADKLLNTWAQASRIIPAVNRAHWHDWDFQWAVEGCCGRKGYHAITDKCWKPGGARAAAEIQSDADSVLHDLVELHAIPGDKTWRRTLGDIKAMAHLGNYYAEKLRAADLRDKSPQQAISHLEDALEHWKKYAAIGSKQYTPQLLSKGGYVDWHEGTVNAQRDIALLQSRRKNHKTK